MNAGSGIDAAQKGIALLSLYINNPKQVIPYQSKEGQQFDFAKKQKDFADGKYECKKALSEIDFKNLDGCMNNLNTMCDMLHQY